MTEVTRLSWKCSGKPPSQLTEEELAEAIRYLDASERPDGPLLKALKELRAQHQTAGAKAAETHDGSGFRCRSA